MLWAARGHGRGPELITEETTVPGTVRTPAVGRVTGHVWLCTWNRPGAVVTLTALAAQRLEAEMKRRILRLWVVMVTATGLVGLISTAAHARITANHSEPLR
jgi:hypothetical protein